MKPILRAAMLLLVICSMSLQVFAMPPTNAAEWALNSITLAYEAGLVPDSLLNQATSEISRKDFTTLAVRFYTKATGKAATPKNPSPFQDVDIPEITFAFENKIISGRTEKEFYPDQSLTREQMAIIITRTLTAVGDTLDEPFAPAPFTDTANLTTAAQTAVTQLYYLNITSGFDGFYYPNKSVTVQEAILAFYNAYDYYTGKIAMNTTDIPAVAQGTTGTQPAEQLTKEKTTQEVANPVNSSNTPASNASQSGSNSAATPSQPSTANVSSDWAEGEETEITIGNKTLALGQSERSLKQTAGIPDRIDQDSYGYERYVYLNGYADLFFVSLEDGKIIEIYTGSDNFEYMGVNGKQYKKDIKNIKFHDQRNFRVELPTETVDSYILLDHEEGIEGILLRDKKFRDLIDRRYNKTFETGAVLELMDLMNQARARQGQPLLTHDDTAAAIANKHSFNMVKNAFVEYNDHTGKNPFERMAEGGLEFTMAAELAGKYQGDAINIYHEWMRNIGTRSNVLNGSLTHAGIGINMDNYTIYITADLFKP